jgi:hypothetical protein
MNHPIKVSTEPAAGQDDEIWLLADASKPSGFMPNTVSAANAAKRLEREGFLHGDGHGFAWGVSDRGRAALALSKKDEG